MILISQFALATEEENPLLTPYRPGVPSTFLGSDENLFPEDMKRFGEAVGEVISVLGNEANLDHVMRFSLLKWKESLQQNPYTVGELPGAGYVGSHHLFTGEPIFWPLEHTEETPWSPPGERTKEVNESHFKTLEELYDFLHFMPLVSDKKTILYGTKPYETYIHQEWRGVTSDPDLALTSHRAGPCILFGVRNTVTGRRALFHTIGHLYCFRLALYFIQEIAENHLENLDIQMACGVLTPTSLAFVTGLNKIMTAHRGIETHIPLHAYPSICVGDTQYYRSEEVLTNMMTREDQCFGIGMTVSKEGFNIFDSRDANDVFPAFGFISPSPDSLEILLAMKPASAGTEDWTRHVKRFTHGSFGGFPHGEEDSTTIRTPSLEVRHI
jgi:hypothetical protein